MEIEMKNPKASELVQEAVKVATNPKGRASIGDQAMLLGLLAIAELLEELIEVLKGDA